MPYFKAKVISLQSGLKSIREEYADTKIEVINNLSNNFKILNVKEIKKVKRVKLKNSDILFFFSYLFELTKIGVNVQESLSIMSLEIKSKNIKVFVQSVYDDIKSGLIFSKAIKNSANGISDFYISIVAMGEVSNNLEQSFEYIVNYINVSNIIKSKTRKAMIYPIFLLCLIGGILTAASTFMIPKMMEFGNSMGIATSTSTLVLKSFAGFMKDNWYKVISGVISFFTGIKILTKVSPFAKEKWDWIKLHLPIVSTIIVKSNIAKFCIFFSVAYKSGTNIIDALEKSKDVITNEVIKKEIGLISSKVQYGSTISEAMENSIIPTFTVRMFKIGEATGGIANSLDNVVNFYTREIDSLSDSLISSIKPVGILIAGGMIIWIISATILPIYTQFIGKMM